MTLCYIIPLLTGKYFYPTLTLCHASLQALKDYFKGAARIWGCSNGRTLKSVCSSSSDYSQGAQAQRGNEWQRSARELEAKLRYHAQCSYYHRHSLLCQVIRLGRILAWFWKSCCLISLTTTPSFPVSSSSLLSPSHILTLIQEPQQVLGLLLSKSWSLAGRVLGVEHVLVPPSRLADQFQGLSGYLQGQVF